MGSCVGHFNVFINCVGKVTRQCPQTTIFEEKRKESRSGSNQGPSAYQPSALPLGHTGSHEVGDVVGHFYIAAVSGVSHKALSTINNNNSKERRAERNGIWGPQLTSADYFCKRQTGLHSSTDIAHYAAESELGADRSAAENL